MRLRLRNTTTAILSFLSYRKWPSCPNPYSSPLGYSGVELQQNRGTNCHGYDAHLQQIESSWRQLKRRPAKPLSKSDSCRCAVKLPEGMSLVDIVTLESYQWSLTKHLQSVDDGMTVAAYAAPERRRRR
jgi:hypothetical protein